MYNSKRMKIILNKDNKDLGKKGDIVNVSDGFAFNTLIPSGIASPATKKTMANLERQRANEEAKQVKQVEATREDAKKLDKKKITIVSQAEGNKLFGSVNQKQIVEAVKKQHNIEIEESMIVLASPLKELTTLEVVIDYGNDVKAGVILTISSK